MSTSKLLADVRNCPMCGKITHATILCEQCDRSQCCVTGCPRIHAGTLSSKCDYHIYHGSMGCYHIGCKQLARFDEARHPNFCAEHRCTECVQEAVPGTHHCTDHVDDQDKARLAHPSEPATAAAGGLTVDGTHYSTEDDAKVALERKCRGGGGVSVVTDGPASFEAIVYLLSISGFRPLFSIDGKDYTSKEDALAARDRGDFNPRTMKVVMRAEGDEGRELMSWLMGL
jgi:hypothetical protein